MSTQPISGFTQNASGIFSPIAGVEHREEEYDSAAFDVLRNMQSRHFWYRGRHRFLLHAVKAYQRSPHQKAIDLGGGCGGWVAYLNARAPHLFDELALADSSLRALEYAQTFVGAKTQRYQIDLLDLPWEGAWDAVFLLDVLEHIPDDAAVLAQIRKVLRPGGHLFVTTPAFPAFWSYNDDAAHHVRRYRRRDFRRLADAAGLELRTSRYFMFLLSPLLLMSRLFARDVKGMTPAEVQAIIARTHRVPAAPLNELLAGIFAAETPLGYWLPFPWGTSILGVFRRPQSDNR